MPPIEGSLTTQAETPAPSLRDTLTTAYESVEERVAPPSATPSVAATTASPEPTAAAAPKPDDAGRVRGADGKFVAKDTAAPAQVAAAPDDEYRPPKGWKNDYRPHWDKLAKGQALTREEAQAVGKYWEEREGEFAKGVSTYKQEWDRAKPILEALHPYRDLIANANTTPDKFVAAIGDTHRVLTSGSPQDKLREIARFATAYGVPLHELFEQREDGKIYQNQQYFQPQQQTQQAHALTAEDVDKRVAQQLARAQLTQHINTFKEAKDASGNPQYPHHEAVWKTMDGILRAGLAQDLPSAYKAALALPQHSDLIQATAPQPTATDEAAKKRAAAEAASKARAQAVSPRNQAQTSLTTATPKRDGLRAQLESAFDQHLGSGGRV